MNLNAPLRRVTQSNVDEYLFRRNVIKSYSFVLCTSVEKQTTQQNKISHIRSYYFTWVHVMYSYIYLEASDVNSLLLIIFKNKYNTVNKKIRY